MCIACWITKATNTHSQYVILFVFPLQQWLDECASLLLYTYIVCIVQYCNNYVLVMEYNTTQFLRSRFDVSVYIAVRFGARRGRLQGVSFTRLQIEVTCDFGVWLLFNISDLREILQNGASVRIPQHFITSGQVFTASWSVDYRIAKMRLPEYGVETRSGVLSSPYNRVRSPRGE